MKRRVVLLVAVVAGAAILAPSAFAHNSGLTVTGSCNPATGKYDLTWTVGPTTDTGLAPFIAVSNRTAIPVNTLLPTTPTDASIKDFPESVSLAAGSSASATITVGWSDGYRADQAAAFTAPAPCVQETGSLKLSKTLSGGPAGYTVSVHHRLQLRRRSHGHGIGFCRIVEDGQRHPHRNGVHGERVASRSSPRLHVRDADVH